MRRWTEGAARAAVFLSACLFCSLPAQLLSDGPARSARAKPVAVSAGLLLNADLRAASYFNLPRAWQLGLQLRSGFWGASNGFESLPEALLEIRKLWVGDGDGESARNPEYLGAGVGGFFGYDLAGKRIGPNPFAAVTAGKYWMPFDALPLGLDASVELSRYFGGVPPHRPRQNFFTAGLSVFYEL